MNLSICYRLIVVRSLKWSKISYDGVRIWGHADASAQRLGYRHRAMHSVVPMKKIGTASSGRTVTIACPGISVLANVFILFSHLHALLYWFVLVTEY